MRMRRVFAILFSLYFLVVTCGSGIALADDDNTVAVSVASVNPASLPNDGQDHAVAVEVNVTVAANRAEGGLPGAHIEGSGSVVKTSESADVNADGAPHSINCTLNISASQLGSDIQIQLYVASGSNRFPFTVLVKTSSPAAPQVNFTRTIDKTSAAKGDFVTLAFRVENKSALSFTDLSFFDSGVSQQAIKAKDSLAAGDVYEFSYAYTVNADFTSNPKLTYSAGGTSYTVTCAPKTVTLQTAQLDVLLEASPPTVSSGDATLLQCTVTNSGNVNLSNITISENTLGKKLFPAFSMDAGSPSKYYTWNVSLTQSAKFQFVLTANDDSGNTYTFQSNVLNVTVSPNGQYDFEFAASADAIRLSEPGNVNFSISIVNKGTEPVQNVSVKDQSGATIKSFPLLPTGQTMFVYQASVKKTTQFNFSLVAPNADGTEYQAYSGPLQVEVAEAPASASNAATRTAASTTAAATGSMGKMSSLIAALLVIGVLIAITIIVLIAMIVSDRRRRM